MYNIALQIVQDTYTVLLLSFNTLCMYDIQFMLSVIGRARILYGYEFPIPHHAIQLVFPITHNPLQLAFHISSCDQGLERN